MSHSRKKITIVGAGFVGSTCAHWAAQKSLGDIVLLDVNEGAAKGKSLDLFQASPIEHFNVSILGTSNYEEMKDSDLVILTAGMPRKPGMSRDDLVGINAKIVKENCEAIKKFAPNSIVIVVCNPMDVMAVYAKQILGFPRERVIGMGGVLDSARFRAFIAEELNVSPLDVQGFVIGNHGDAMMPVSRLATVGGIPALHLMKAEKMDAIVARTKQAGAEIGAHLKTGSAYFAPARGTIEIAEAIIKDQKRVLPIAVELNGEYGVPDKLIVGVVAKVGSRGVEEIYPINLNEDEKQMFTKSVEAVRNLVSLLNKI